MPFRPISRRQVDRPGNDGQHVIFKTLDADIAVAWEPEWIVSRPPSCRSERVADHMPTPTGICCTSLPRFQLFPCSDHPHRRRRPPPTACVLIWPTILRMQPITDHVTDSGSIVGSASIFNSGGQTHVGTVPFGSTAGIGYTGFISIKIYMVGNPSPPWVSWRTISLHRKSLRASHPAPTPTPNPNPGPSASRVSCDQGPADGWSTPLCGGFGH